MPAGHRPTDEFLGSDPRAPFCRASVVSRLVRRLELAQGSEVLEWGVARGSTVATLVKLGMTVTLVEPDEEALDRVLQETRVEVNAGKGLTARTRSPSDTPTSQHRDARKRAGGHRPRI